ncbi:MAG: aminopeptidase P family protein [Anaerolineae bacterium]
MPVPERLAAVRQRIAEENLDALVVSSGINRRYLSGFTGSAGVLIIRPTQLLFAVDSRYYEQVGQQSPGFALERVGYDFVGNLARMLEGAYRVGFEAGVVTVAEFQEWREKTPGLEWAPTKGLVEGIRAVKEPGELASIRAAAALTDAAFAFVCGFICPGMTEKAVGWELEKFFRENGAKNWSDGPIVASGPNSALPHARPSERIIGRGEPIVIDLGCLVDGYHSDMTRTIILGEADAKFEEVYSLVLHAEENALDKVHAGMSGKVADALARDIIEAAGYGENFGHSLGHGVGLAIHELPTARKIAEEPLGVDMTLTIEPGVYIPGWGGVRVEDLVVIEANGVQRLSHAPKALADMVIPV